MSPVDSKKKAEIEQRRAKVAANLLAGLDYRDIAEALGCSLGTVAGDAKVIHARWQAAQIRDRDARVTLETKRLDRALNGIWVKVLDGNLGAVEMFRRLAERRAKLLGLDAPKVIVTLDAVEQLLERLPEDVRSEISRLLGRDDGAEAEGGTAEEAV